jgi:hypothetical protein
MITKLYPLKTKKGKHIRMATKVILNSGKVICFTERLSKKEAINHIKGGGKRRKMVKIREIVGDNEKVVWIFSEGKQIATRPLFLGSMVPAGAEENKVLCPIFLFLKRKREYWEAEDYDKPYELKGSQEEDGKFFLAKTGEKYKILSPEVIEDLKL